MKSKLILKVIIMTLTILFVLNVLNVNVWAALEGNFDVGAFDTAVADDTIKSPVKTVIGAIIAFMRIICTAIALIMLAVIGMKYLIASPGERADLKKTLVQFVVGAFVLFGAAGILTILQGAIVELVK